MHLFLWTYNISQINFHVVYLASSHLPLHFELPLVQVKSQNHVFFLIFSAFSNMPEVNLQMKRRVLSTRSHSTYSEIQFHLQDLNFSLIIMMTKITDNGIRFIIMIPLTVQPISSVLAICFWITSFVYYHGGALSQNRTTVEPRLLRLAHFYGPFFPAILGSCIQDS